MLFRRFLLVVAVITLFGIGLAHAVNDHHRNQRNVLAADHLGGGITTVSPTCYEGRCARTNVRFREG